MTAYGLAGQLCQSTLAAWRCLMTVQHSIIYTLASYANIRGQYSPAATLQVQRAGTGLALR